MTSGSPAELATLQAAAGDPIQIERIQNELLARTLVGLARQLSDVKQELCELRGTMDRRTAIFTPARGFSSSLYQHNGMLHAFLCHPVYQIDLFQPSLCQMSWTTISLWPMA